MSNKYVNVNGKFCLVVVLLIFVIFVLLILFVKFVRSGFLFEFVEGLSSGFLVCFFLSVLNIEM